MIYYGSCNGYKFGVPAGSAPARIGLDEDRPSSVVMGWRDASDTSMTRIWADSMAGKLGIPVGWEYEGSEGLELDPRPWCVWDADGTIKYVWEGEHRACMRSQVCPMLLVDQSGSSIVPAGGGYGQVILPGYVGDGSGALDVIEAAVEAADLPNWVTNTAFGWIDGCAGLLQHLFITKCLARGLYRFESLEELFLREVGEWHDWYVLLWLRAASQILYDHVGESCIPVILERIKISGNLMVGA